MLQFAHQCDLTQNSLAVCLVLENVLHSLDCYLLPCASPRGQGHFAIATRAKESLADVVIADLPVAKLIEAEIAATTPLRRRIMTGRLLCLVLWLLLLLLCLNHDE